MKHIEQFRNIHAGKDIWMLGSGPSLENFPDDFFDDKISIAVNWSFIAFPNCTYYWSMGTWFPAWVKKNRPEALRKYISGYTLSIPFNKRRRWNMLNQWGDDVFCYALVTPARLARSLDEVKRVVNSILAGKRTEFFDRGTSIHPASQAAVTFGAKRIYYAGCEARTSATHLHAQTRGMNKFYKEAPKQYSLAMQRGNWPWFSLCREGLQWLAQALKGRVELIKYYYGKNEEIIR